MPKATKGVPSSDAVQDAGGAFLADVQPGVIAFRLLESRHDDVSIVVICAEGVGVASLSGKGASNACGTMQTGMGNSARDLHHYLSALIGVTGVRRPMRSRS